MATQLTNTKWLGKAHLNYGGTPKLWALDCSATGGNDTIANINNSGYFNASYNDLAVGDIIFAVGTDATAILLVTTNNYDPVAGTGAVDVTDGTTIAAGNAD